MCLAHSPHCKLSASRQTNSLASRTIPSRGLPLQAPIAAFSTSSATSSSQSVPLQPFGLSVKVRNLTYHPPGTDTPLLDGISMDLPSNSLGLIVGRSGSGKTTLLQCLAGLLEQSEGEILLGSSQVHPAQVGPSSSTSSDRMKKVGIVWQFPERHFLGETVAEELSFGWPPGDMRWQAASRTQQVLAMVGLSSVPLHLSPVALSGGQQRRLALAVQLARRPSLLLLDEPLAGLDWRSRAEVASLLAMLKKQCTLLVVSHDLKEIGSLVDTRFEMSMGGRMKS